MSATFGDLAAQIQELIFGQAQPLPPLRQRILENTPDEGIKRRVVPRERQNERLRELMRGQAAMDLRPGEWDRNEAEARATLAPLLRTCAQVIDDSNVVTLLVQWANAIDGDLLAYWQDDGNETTRKILPLFDATGEGKWLAIRFDYMLWAELFSGNNTVALMSSLTASRLVTPSRWEHGELRLICVSCNLPAMQARVAPILAAAVVSDDTKAAAQPDPAKASKARRSGA